jgi:hypothetical protein
MAGRRRLVVRRALTRAVTEHPVLKAMSLLLAFGIWAWLQTERVIDRPARAQVTYSFPEGLTPVDDVARTLIITVRGPQGRVRALEGGSLAMGVDLSEREGGKVSVDFSEIAIVGLPDGLEIVQISPPGVELQLDKEISRIVRVRPAVIGEPADGWNRGPVTVDPITVEIRGPLSVVRNIAEVSTDIVDISGSRKTQEKSVALAIDRRTVRAVDQTKVTVTVGVEAIIDTRTFTDVPVVVGVPGWHATIETAQVALEGPMQSIKSLRADQMSVQLHLPDIAIAPGEGPIEVNWDPDDDDSNMEFIHQGPQDVITVKSVRPSTIQLEPDAIE